MNSSWKSFFMNENEIEKLLSGMRPAAASLELEERIEHDLAFTSGLRVIDGPSKPQKIWWQPLAWTGLGAAAAIMIMSLSPAVKPYSPYASISDQKTTALPVSSTREWVNADDQGVRFNSQQIPERHLKLISTERHEWIDPRDGAQISVEIPREDTVVLPVKFQ